MTTIGNGTDADGLPTAVACAWHGAHYAGEVCPGRPADDEPLPDLAPRPGDVVVTITGRTDDEVRLRAEWHLHMRRRRG